MTTLVTVLIVAVCFAVGIWVYFHNGPDGGRDPGLNEEQVRMRRIDNLATTEELEAEYQKRQRPPTHEDG